MDNSAKLKYTHPKIVDRRLEKEVGFSLQLSDGQGWNLVGTEEVLPWLRELAGIMQLRTHELNGSPRLIFTKEDPTEKDNPLITLEPQLLEGLPKKGWKAWDVKTIKYWTHSDVPHVVCELAGSDSKDMDIIRMWHALNPIYQKVQEGGGFPFHCGFVVRDGKGYLFAAPGNTGKSTCCRRIPPPWRAVSDDEVLIVKNKDGNYYVHPCPTWSTFLWKGGEVSSWNIEEFYPLCGIFFLEQAPEDSIEPVNQGQAAVFMNDSASQVARRNWRQLDPDYERMLKRRVFENACELTKKIPSFILKVSLTGKFWEKMDEALQ
ncbi:MAG: SynChlorMet cassette protein ScmC [Candidatus Saganbacteria bacterium]|nr:SynChlorMet cassette protein ScmC [Candidatus Saganbacteria bacterium]